MTDPNEIEEYSPRRAEVVDDDGVWVHAVFPDDVPETGEAIRLGAPGESPPVANVREHLGGRRVRALMPRPHPEVAAGRPVERTERAAVVPAPEDRRLDLSQVDAAVEGEVEGDAFPFAWTRPSFGELTGLVGPRPLDHRGIALIAPPAGGGLNLFIDRTPSDRSWSWFAAELADREEADAAVWLDPPESIDPDDQDWVLEPGRFERSTPVGLRIATCLVSHLRDAGRNVYLAAELPALRRTASSEEETATGTSFGELVERLGTALASTQDGRCTVALRLPLADSDSRLEGIVETLDLGDVDAQIAVDSEGRFRPRRSISDVDPPPDREDERRRAMSALRTARRAEEKRDLFGDRELTDDQVDALERTEALRGRLGPGDECDRTP
ncbi:MAG: hypothetical protein ABEL76_16445 [Bradymonadaceae bacterium]